MLYFSAYCIKITQKTGTCTEFCRGSGLFSVLHLRSRSVVGTLLKLRLRRHLPRGFILVKIDFYFGFDRFCGMVEAVDFFEVPSRPRHL